MTTFTEAQEETRTYTFERYLSLGEVCEIVGVPKATFYTKRVNQRGWGPRSTKIGRELRFHPVEVQRWLDSLPVEAFPEDMAVS